MQELDTQKQNEIVIPKTERCEKPKTAFWGKLTEVYQKHYESMVADLEIELEALSPVALGAIVHECQSLPRDPKRFIYEVLSAEAVEEAAKNRLYDLGYRYNFGGKLEKNIGSGRYETIFTYRTSS